MCGMHPFGRQSYFEYMILNNAVCKEYDLHIL